MESCQYEDEDELGCHVRDRVAFVWEKGDVALNCNKTIIKIADPAFTGLTRYYAFDTLTPKSNIKTDRTHSYRLQIF